jgi:hypothetical protein
MSGELGGQDHPQPKCSENRSDGTLLANTSCRRPRRSSLRVGMHNPAGRTLCPHALLLENQNDVILQVPLAYGAVQEHRSYKLLLAGCRAHGICACWNDVFTTLCGFLGAQNLVFCFSRTNRDENELHN